MTETRPVATLEINAELIGRRVCNPLRPEWGTGTVLRLQTTTADGQTIHRVSVQFTTGHRTLVIPPGQLAVPEGEPERTAGWLETIGKQTIDHRLADLPEAIRTFLGSSAQRMVVLARLYEWDAEPGSLLHWARSQTGVADPLSLWSRDELHASFAEFCRRRDAAVREAIAALRRTAGPRALAEALSEVPDYAREAILALVRGPGER